MKNKKDFFKIKNSFLKIKIKSEKNILHPRNLRYVCVMLQAFEVYVICVIS